MNKYSTINPLSGKPSEENRSWLKVLNMVLVISIATLPVVLSCFYDNEEYLFPVIDTQCDTVNVTFSGSVTTILSNHCLSCHSNSTAAAFGGNIRLEDYADVKARVDDQRLPGSINHESGYSPMPMGASKLDDCSISMIRIWIDSGAPNN